MNIFFLSLNPKQAAEYQIDRHVVKMITETSQILSNCYTLEQLKHAPQTINGYRSHSYPYHPCCLWVKESISNFKWLVDHGIYLFEEKKNRFGGYHQSVRFIRWCLHNQPELPSVEMTTPALAFNNYPEFQNYNDPVGSYINYYKFDKRYDKSGKWMAYYTNRSVPEFWGEYYDEVKQHNEYK